MNAFADPGAPATPAATNEFQPFADTMPQTQPNEYPTAFAQVMDEGVLASLRGWMAADSLLARALFLVMLVLLFALLLRLLLSLVLYVWPPSDSPFLVSGVLDGRTSLTIAQDPALQSGGAVLRSRNQESGLEFTWGLWLFINDAQLQGADLSRQHVVFSKGRPKTQAGPALLVGYEATDAGSEEAAAGARAPDRPGGANVAFLSVKMDMFDGMTQTLRVRNVPIYKWFHIALRAQNTALDVYINGTVTDHFVLSAVPKQNYSDVYVFPSAAETGASAEGSALAATPFSGYLSDLVYYPYALNAYRLYAVVQAGPNKAMAAANSLSTALTRGQGTDFLSTDWYAGAMRSGTATTVPATHT